LRRVFETTVRWKWLSYNPVRDARPPRVAKPEPVPVPPEVIPVLIEEAAKHNPELAACIVLAADTGARRALSDQSRSAGSAHVDGNLPFRTFNLLRGGHPDPSSAVESQPERYEEVGDLSNTLGSPPYARPECLPNRTKGRPPSMSTASSIASRSCASNYRSVRPRAGARHPSAPGCDRPRARRAHQGTRPRRDS